MKENIIILVSAFLIIGGYFLAAVPGIIGVLRAKRGWLAINTCLTFAGLAGVMTFPGMSLTSGGHLNFLSVLLTIYSAAATLLIAFQLTTGTKLFKFDSQEKDF